MVTASYHGLSCTIAFDSEPLKGVSIALAEKPSFFKKLIITISNPRLLLFIWRARKPGIESTLVDQLTVAMNGFERAVGELRSIK